MLRKVIKILAGLVLVAMSPFVLLLVLSELNEVVVIRTALPDGGIRTTRIWVVDTEEGPLVRGTDDKPWVIGARSNPSVTVERGGQERQWVAVEKPSLEDRRRADELMLEKYGTAERGIRMLRDFERSVVFVLKPPAP